MCASLCGGGSLCQGRSLSRGSLSRYGLCQEGVSVRGVSVQGVSVQGGASVKGVSVQREVSVHGGDLSGRPHRTVKSGLYASYWNTFLLSTCFQSTWLTKLRESQDKYKDALRRGQDGVTPAYEDPCPSSPHVKMPSALKSNLPSAEKAAAAPVVASTAAEGESITVEAQIEPGGPCSPSTTESSGDSKSLDPVKQLPALTALCDNASTVSLPVSPPKKEGGITGFIRHGSLKKKLPSEKKVSISPPPSPAGATRGRSRRLGTLKALHEKAKSMHAMYV